MSEKFMSTIDNGEKQVPYVELGDVAEGSIGGTIETHPRLDEQTERIGAREFHVTTELRIPCGCIDGRCGGELCPNAAGGTLSIAIADDLLEQYFASDGTTADMVRQVFRHLKEKGVPVGDHTAETIHGENNSGCGASDNLAAIYRLMVEKADTIRTLAAACGLVVGETDHDMIIAGASRRTTFSTGIEVLDAMTEEAGKENVPALEGDHGETIAVINRRFGTTLDRDALKKEFGEAYEAFNIDVWSFEAAARELYPDGDEEMINRTVTAMVYYNLATALTLCGPTMRVVILE